MNPLSRLLPHFQKPDGWLRLQRNASVQWQRLAPRERRLVTLAALVTGAAIIWLVLFEPAWNTLQRVRTELPSLRGQAAQLDTILAESRALQQRVGTAGTATPGEEAITGSLTRAGLQAHMVVTHEANGWLVTLEQAPIEPTLMWLRDMPAELRLEAAHAALQRPAGDQGQTITGVVTGTILLAPPEATP